MRGDAVAGVAVAGVAVADDDLEAGAVVLATGGFGANPSLIAQHLPSLAPSGDWLFYIGPESFSEGTTGPGRPGRSPYVGHDRFVSLLGPRVDGREFDGWVPNWMLLVGPDGHRLMDETGPYGVTSGLAVAAGGRVFGLFDEQLLAANGTPELPTFKPYPSGRQRPVTVWTTDSIRRLVASGAIVQAETLEDVAGTLGVPAAAVVQSVKRYNESAASDTTEISVSTPKFFGKSRSRPFMAWRSVPLRSVSRRTESRSTNPVRCRARASARSLACSPPVNAREGSSAPGT